MIGRSDIDGFRCNPGPAAGATRDDWLRGKASAVSLTFDVDVESATVAGGRRDADHAYGPLAGVRRILVLLADLSLTATFFVTAPTAERHPGLIGRIAEEGHEVGHHSCGHRRPAEPSENEVRADLERALAAFERIGVWPLGHRTTLWTATWLSQALVAEYGLLYDSTLMDDDRPYVLETGKGEVVELPPHRSLDDWAQYAFLPESRLGVVIESPKRVLSLWKSELDTARRYGSLFMLTSNPSLSGRPDRMENLRRLIEYALDLGDVEILDAGEIARRALADASIPRRELRRDKADPAAYPDA